MSRSTVSVWLRRLGEGITFRRVGLILLGAMIATFGIHNIHQQTGITEGGVIGLMLFVEHWLGVSPAFITPVLDLSCYLLAFKYLGGGFIKISATSWTTAPARRKPERPSETAKSGSCFHSCRFCSYWVSRMGRRKVKF